MHRYTPLCFVLLLTLCSAPAALAQEDGAEHDTRYFMMNQHVCPGEGLDGMMESVETMMGPIMGELRDEGMIDDWGVLTHAWGDEYNFNFYMIADDHEAWLAAWGEMVGRMNERHEGWAGDLSEYCTMHKDNLYTLHSWN